MAHFYTPYTKLKLAVLLLLWVAETQAQSGGNSKKQDLFTIIFYLDSAAFSAFNNRNVDEFKKYFSDSLEFYHDKGGRTGYSHTINFLQQLKDNPANDLRRDLLKDKMEVFPIPGFGAMQIGEHRFCHTENGKPDCGIFKFVNIWQQINDSWKVIRVVSYNH